MKNRLFFLRWLIVPGYLRSRPQGNDFRMLNMVSAFDAGSRSDLPKVM